MSDNKSVASDVPPRLVHTLVDTCERLLTTEKSFDSR